MAKLVNLARMAVNGGGTGTLTLTGSVTGAQTFIQAGVNHGDTVSYSIMNGNHREVGRGVFNQNTLERTQVLDSTNGGNKINVQGGGEVMVTLLAEDLTPEELGAATPQQLDIVANALAAHASDESNPHNVTAAQVGAPTTAQFSAHAGATDNPHNVTAAQVGAPTLAQLTAHINASNNPHNVTAAQVGAPTTAQMTTADNGVLSTIRDGVVTAGNTLAKLYNLLTSHTGARDNPHNVTAAQAGAIPSVGNHLTITGEKRTSGSWVSQSSTSYRTVISQGSMAIYNAVRAVIDFHGSSSSTPHFRVSATSGLISMESVAGRGSVIVYPSSVSLAFGSSPHSFVFQDDGNVVYYQGTTARWTPSQGWMSMRELKENVEPITDALSKVKQLTGITYNLKEFPDEREAGLFAEDVEPILPEAVGYLHTEERDYKLVRYERLTALLIEAVKELEARVAQLEG